MYPDVPPITVVVIEPFKYPQFAGTIAVIDAVGSGVPLIIAVAVAVHPITSDTVTL